MGKLREAHGPLLPIKPQPGDKLRHLFEAQRALMAVYEVKHPDRRLESRSLRLAELADALAAEAQELKAWTPWKRWRADYGRELTKEEEQGVVEELVDLLHFLLEACVEAGLDHVDLAGYYLAKNRENRARQDRGY